MSDFTVSVDFDASAILRGFAKLEQDAKAAGASAGKGLAEGLQGFSSRSITALQQELQRLTQRQLRVDVDSRAFTVTGERIRAVQAQLDSIQRKQVAIGVDDRSITALQSKLQALQARQVRVDVDSSEFVDLQRQINIVERELADVERRRIRIDVDTNSITAITSRLQSDLDRLQQRQLRIDVDSQEFRDLGREIDRIQDELAQVERNRVTVGVDDRSIVALQSKLQALQARQVKVDVDSSEFLDLQREINRTQTEIAEIERNRVLIDVDSNSITALNVKLQGMQNELSKVAIGSQRFRELQAEIRETEGELRDATQSAGGLRGVMESLGPAIAAIGIGAGLAAFTKGAFDAAVAAESAQVRIKALGDQFGEADQIQQMVAKSAKQLNISNTEAADGFLQLYGALRPTGISLNDINTVFTATNAAAKNFGLSAGSVQAAVLQLSQGLAAGTLQGDELRSIMEQMPPVAQAIAKELGITVGQVKQFGSEGRITSEVVIRAIKGMNEVELGKLTTTLQSTQERINAQKVAFNELSVTVGNVFVRATLPAIEALTNIAKGLADAAQAAIDAPGPLKVLAGVVVGLPAAYLAARLAVIAFNSELIGGQIKAAIAGVKALGALLKTQFIADVATAKAAWAAFSTSVQTGALQQQIGALASKFGPLALAIGGVVAAIASYNASTADSQKIAQVAAAGQDELTKALAAAGIETSKLTTLGGPFARAWENGAISIDGLLAPLRNIPGVGDLVANSLKKVWDAISVGMPFLKLSIDGFMALARALKGAIDDANATQGLENAAIALGNLQTQSTAAQNAAAKLFAELKNAGGPPNTAQLQQITATANALVAAREQAVKLRDQYLQLAAAARNSGNQQLAQEYEALAKAAGQDIKLSDIRLQQLNSLLPANQKITAATKEQEAAIKARAAAEAQLNKIIAEAPIRNLDAQLAVGQQLLNLAQAIGQAEQSRYAVTRSALGFELQQAEKRGASEQQIGAIKARIEANDKAALQARFQALTTEQALQRTMLALTQEKARAEANLAVMQQRAELLKAQAELQKAVASGDRFAIDAAQAQVNLQQQILGIQQNKVGLLAQTQPLERAALGFQQQAATNGLRAEAAAKGYSFALNGTLQPANRLAELQGRIGTITKASAGEQERYGRLAAQSGLAIGRAADGTLVLGKTQRDVNTAVGEMNRQLTGAKNGYDATSQSAGRAKTSTDGIRQALQSAGLPADRIADLLGDAETSARSATGNTNQLKTGLQQSVAPAGGIASAFVSTGKNAPAAAQGARDFAAFLSRAKVFAENIRDIRLESRMALVRDRTNEAANAAKVFYEWLLKASNLPGSRWTGGPVDAGGEYKINELGQEAFLAGGRLSLINAAPNSVWRAPSDGVVIPAGMTAQLQARAAVEASGGNPGVAELAVEVGKLRAEVGNLARRDWSVHVQHRTGPTGSQVMRTLLS